MEVGTDQQFEFLRDWQQKVYENGYVGMSWPKEDGGLGADWCFRISPPKPWPNIGYRFCPIPLNWAGPLILAMGSEEEKRQYIKGILSAKILVPGFFRARSRLNLGSAQCKAVKDGDEYVINGSKIWTVFSSYANT